MIIFSLVVGIEYRLQNNYVCKCYSSQTRHSHAIISLNQVQQKVTQQKMTNVFYMSFFVFNNISIFQILFFPIKSEVIY